MKRILYSFFLVFFPLASSAQGNYESRYDLIVSKLGYDGVGVETLLNNWEKEDSTNIKMLAGKFNYYFTKSQKVEIVPKPLKKFLGEEPIVTLKDSTGNDVNYFQEVMFDDELYGSAASYLEKILKLYPERLDMKFLKAASLIAYEKDSPDMALACLADLADSYYADKNVEWEYPGEEVDDVVFESAMQEYCYMFFNMGLYEAFRTMSEKMLEHVGKKSPVFLANMGSYFLVAGADYKKAMSYYRKVLKIKPDDYSAIKNMILIARKTKDIKLEKKYLPLLAEYGTDSEKLAAKSRLEALELGKK